MTNEDRTGLESPDRQDESPEDGIHIDIGEVTVLSTEERDVSVCSAGEIAATEDSGVVRIDATSSEYEVTFGFVGDRAAQLGDDLLAAAEEAERDD